jgi:hypothetical protein
MNSYSTEELSNINMEKLQKEFLSVRAAIHIAKKRKNDATELEIYYCYITRELDYRENIRNKNANYRVTS